MEKRYMVCNEEGETYKTDSFADAVKKYTKWCSKFYAATLSDLQENRILAQKHGNDGGGCSVFLNH